MTIAAGTKLGRYEIRSKLAEGGMGEVYLAEDTKLERKVAIKFLSSKATADSHRVKRLIREAKSVARLDHPNICSIYEVGEEDGRTFIVMQYVEGETLASRIHCQPLELCVVIDLGAQTADALAEAHARGIIHRDIKPANIMITSRGQVKVMDFGLAKVIREQAAMATEAETRSLLTNLGMIVGTVPYMSPEQARGETVDHRTDIWSLGVVLYEMIVGRLPFKSEYNEAIIYSILNEESKPPTALRSDVPMELERIVTKAMQKNRTLRYQHMDELLTDLKILKKESESGISIVQPFTKKSVPSIAVLPFADMSEQKDQEYFCDGIAEELINDLSHIQDLHVVARTSAFSFKGTQLDVREIGKKLNVSSVLEGSIRKAGNRLRITAQLVNVVDGYHLWSEKFDRDMKNIFAIQDEISLAIVNHLKLKLLAGEKAALEKRHTDDPGAYSLYLKGRFFNSKMSPEAFEKALEYFRAAVEKDPSFALPYAGIAQTFGAYGVLSLLPPKEILPKAKAALRKALELDDSLAEAYGISALLSFWFEWEWKTAESHFQKALALNPGMAFYRAMYAWYQLAMGRFDEAISEIEKAQQLDPLMPVFYAMGTGIFHTVGKLDEGIEQFHKAIELDPHIGLAYFHVGRVYFAKGMMKEATSAFQKSIGLALFSGWGKAYLGIIYNLQGERAKAEKLLDELIERKKKMFVSPVSIALLAYDLDKPDTTFDFFQRAFEERDSLMPFLNVFREFDKIRNEPRFEALLRKMGLGK